MMLEMEPLLDDVAPSDDGVSLVQLMHMVIIAMIYDGWWFMMMYDDDWWWQLWSMTDNDSWSWCMMMISDRWWLWWWWSWLWPRWSLADTLGAMILAYIPWSWWLADFLVDWWSTIFISYSSSTSIFISYSLHQLQLPHPASSVANYPLPLMPKGERCSGGEMSLLGGAHPEGRLLSVVINDKGGDCWSV